MFVLIFVQVELSEAQALCQYIPEISFVMETSAKENLNIKDIFYLLASELMVSYGLISKGAIFDNHPNNRLNCIAGKAINFNGRR